MGALAVVLTQGASTSSSSPSPDIMCSVSTLFYFPLSRKRSSLGWTALIIGCAYGHLIKVVPLFAILYVSPYPSTSPLTQGSLRYGIMLAMGSVVRTTRRARSARRMINAPLKGPGNLLSFITVE